MFCRAIECEQRYNLTRFGVFKRSIRSFEDYYHLPEPELELYQCIFNNKDLSENQSIIVTDN